MNQQKNQFILRQIQFLSSRGEETKTILENVLSKTLSNEEYAQAMSQFDASKSLLRTLSDCRIIQLEESSLKNLLSLEDRENRIPFSVFSETDEMVYSTFQILRHRLYNGLIYALFLLFVATIIFHNIANNVLPGFAEIYASTGAILPEFTKVAIAWQNSWIPPYYLALALILLLVYLLFATKRLTRDITATNYIRWVPFFKNILIFIRSLRWLSHIKILLAMNKPIDSFIIESKEETNLLKRYLPRAIEELSTANQLQTVNEEIDFQINQLASTAELEVTNSSRKFLAVIMSLIVSYVAFILIATYLPIFQLGRAI